MNRILRMWREEDDTNRQLMGTGPRRKNTSSFMAACVLFAVTHKGGVVQYMVAPTPHKDQMESHASYTRDHTYRSNKDEGCQTVCTCKRGQLVLCVVL